MILESKFNIGDIVWTRIEYNGEVKIDGPFTIGMVRVELVDSPGIPGEEIFDNYKPQKNKKEEYMLVETGISCGSVYKVDQLFAELEYALAVKD